jgi:DNA-binding NarL/FixJ family response regulator
MPAKQPERKPQGGKGIVIVDDHSIVRRGLTALINSEPDLAVCGEAATCQAALRAIGQSTPDLVIVDLALEGGDDGLDLVKDMKTRHPKIPVLVLSMHPEEVYAERALRAGARGYLTKQQLDETVLVAIRRLLSGEMYMSDTLAARLATQFVSGHKGKTGETDSPLAGLSDRELQVFRLLGQGRSTREIAQTLHLSMKTIESYREHLKQKLTIASGPALVRRATRWVETGQSS